MIRQPTWGKKKIFSSNNIDTVLKESELDYVVEKKPMSVLLQNYGDLLIQSKVATVDITNNREMGVVGAHYNVCQNSEAFDIARLIENDIQYVSAGETYTGLVYVIAKTDSMTILGDEFSPHIILQTSHNGSASLKATITPLRVICQNQFNILFPESANTLRIAHNPRMEQRIMEAEEVLLDVKKYMNSFNKMANELVNIKAPDISNVIEAIIPIHAQQTELQKERIQAQRDMFEDAYYQDDNANFRGTMYGMVNAYADYITHRTFVKTTEKTDDVKFMDVTFGNGILNSFIESVSTIQA